MLPQMQPSLAAGISRTLHMQHTAKAVASEGTQIIDDSECAAANPNSTHNSNSIVPMLQAHAQQMTCTKFEAITVILFTHISPPIAQVPSTPPLLPHITPLPPLITTPPHLTPDPLSLSVSPVRRLQATPSSPPRTWHIECTTSALPRC